jgi:RHS repeat-associated protein
LFRAVGDAELTEKEEDQETRLTYFGARYLDAELGSWTAADPMRQYHNGYSFVGGNPINFVDPWGLEGELAEGGNWGDTFWDSFQDRGGTWNDGSQQEAAQQADASNVYVTPPTVKNNTKDAVIGPLPAWHPDAETPEHRSGREALDWYNEKYSETGKTRYAIGFSIVSIWMLGVPETNQEANENIMLTGSAPVRWSSHGGKHFAKSGILWKKLIELTKNGPAKYKFGTAVETLERRVWNEGMAVNNGRSWKVMEFSEEIGASGGSASRWMRVEESGGTIHGHPITHDEYLKLTKE